MYGPVLFTTSELLGLLQVSRFRVTAECKSGARFGHGFVDQLAESIYVKVRNRLTTQATAVTQVEYDRFAIGIDDRCGVIEMHLVSIRDQKNRRTAGRLDARSLR